jgi:hypothetical protein
LGQVFVKISSSTDKLFFNYADLVDLSGVRGGAVGWGTAPEAENSRVRFPMLSLEFFI